ncbi:MAG: Hsp70 family protein [Clostridia bacterium]|nr:Hsp70 family protein [Clostridia bacterium]
MAYAIGIDLGTTFSVGAYVDKSGTPHVVRNRDGANTTPSVVMFDGDEIVVGIQAKNNAVADPYNVVQFVKRNMGDREYSFETEDEKVYSAEDISAMILKRIKEDCETVLNEPVGQAVIIVPAYFNDSQRQSTIDAGKIAGLDVLAVINEPTAAALAYGVDKLGTKQRVMVYDIGGGTFDVTIIEVNPDGTVKVLATHGNRNLGGYDFDNRLMEYVADQFKEQTNVDLHDDDEDMQALRVKCEEAKIALSSRERFVIKLSAQRQKATIEITREKFESLIEDLIDETEVDIDITLDDSGLSPRDLDKVLLVGGSSRIPAISNYIEKKLDIRPSGELNPDEVVAIGAAVYANAIVTGSSAYNPDIPASTARGGSGSLPVVVPDIIQDVNSHGLGIITHDEDGIGHNSIIIPRNQPIPVMMDQDYVTMVDGQTCIELQVTEGDDEDLSYVAIIGTAQIVLNPHPAHSPIRVELGYDKNGIITGRVYDYVDECYVGDIIIRRDANMSEEELNAKKARMDGENLQ